MDFEIQIERVWWATTEGADDVADWRRTPMCLDPAWIRAASSKVLQVKAWPTGILSVCLDGASARRLSTDPVTGVATIRLGSFAADVDGHATDKPRDLTLLVDETRVKLGWLAPTHAPGAGLIRQERQPSATPQTRQREWDEALETPRLVKIETVSYAHIEQYAADPAYRWFAASCPEHREMRIIGLLESRIAALGLTADVPILVFPCRKETTETYGRQKAESVPLVMPGLIFILMRPETDIRRLLGEHGASLLEEPISDAWLNSIVHFKREAQHTVELQASTQVMITDGPLIGQTGRLISLLSGTNRATVRIQMLGRELDVELTREQLTAV